MIPDLSLFQSIITSSNPFEPVLRPGVTQIRSRITLIDESILHIRENYILASGWIDYAYQWQTADHQLIIRWDNAHEVSGVTTSPHHQHIGFEENIQPSEPMTLEKVLYFIASRIEEIQLTSN